MFALGLQGSPRKNGNTDFLLNMFMEEVGRLGAQTRIIQVDRQHILPCKEYTVCEKKGTCPIDDDMQHEIYSLLRQADVIVTATPIFFYNVPAQLKALIDRCQTLWARKYMLGLEDPARHLRRGFLLALGATSGKKLFDGLALTTKYFYDAVGASFHGKLYYRGVEKRKDIRTLPGVRADVQKAAADLMSPFLNRKKILFACRENACRSQMAAAFAMRLAGDKWDVVCGGSEPAGQINQQMQKTMAEIEIDLEFYKPKTIAAALGDAPPDVAVTLDCGEACPVLPGAKRLDWEIEDPAGKPIEFMRKVRDEIEKKVKALIIELD